MSQMNFQMLLHTTSQRSLQMTHGKDRGELGSKGLYKKPFDILYGRL
jgi:hypothetical protein